MEHLTTIWAIIKIMFLVGAMGLLGFFLFSLIHPLKFQLKARTTIKGQRAEFWFIYLFNCLKLGVIATPHTQDVLIRILFWEKIIQRNTKKQPPELSKPDTKHKAESQQDKEPRIAPIEAEEPIKEKDDIASLPDQVPEEETSKPVKTEEAETVESPEKEEKTEEESKLATEKHETESTENQPAQPQKEEKSESTELPETIAKEEEEPEEVFPKPLEEVKLPESEKKSEKEKSKDIPLKQKIRNIKKLANKRYKEAKKWIKIGLKKWDILSPVISRFWTRLKKGFSLYGPNIKCRYALHEPYITGMFQGSLAILSGMLDRFGINFVPVPEFNNPMIYVKGETTAKIHPWRLMIALLGLVFEKVVWQQLWAAFKFYRQYSAQLSSTKN